MMTQAVEVPSSGQPSHPIYYAPAWASIHQARGGDNAGEEIDYLSVVRRLWRRKFLILAVCAVVSGASAGVVAFLPRHYVADALVVVENPNGGISTLLIGNNANNPSPLPPPDAEAIQTEVQILQSPALAAEVIRTLKLENQREFNPAVGKSPQSATTKEGAAAQLAQTVKNFLALLHVDRKGESRIIDVGFDARDPKLAAAIANAVVDQYIADQQDLRAKSATQQAQWLQDRINSLQQQATTDEEAIAKFRAKAGLFSGPGGSPLLLKEMADVSDELAKAQATRTTLEDRLRQLRASLSSNVDATSDLLDSPVMRSLRTEEATLQAQFALNSENYGARYPKTIALGAQLAKLKGEMKLEAQQIAAALHNEVDVARMNEQRLTDRLDALKQEVTAMNGSDVTLAALQRQAEADRLVLSNYLARFKEVGYEAGKSAEHPTSEVVSYAQVPVSPTKPKPALLIAIAAVCSLVGGCGFVLFRDKTDRSFRSIEDFEAATGISGLGLVPLAGASMRSPVGISKYGSGSSYREALKAIYTRHFVLFDRQSKTTLVTSAFPGEGKTTIVLSLATLAAQAGHRTIVVDADFWRAGASKALGLRLHAPGLAEVLDSKANLADAVIADSGSGIDILPPGKFSRTSGLTRVDNLARLLEVLAARYEFVIIDSPPVFAVSEALVFAAHADETIMTVRWAKTPRGAVAFALKRLREAGASVAGAVLTFVDERQHAAYGYAESAYFSKEIVSYYARSGAISWSSGSSRAAKRWKIMQRVATAALGAATTVSVEKIGRLIGRSRAPIPKVERIPHYKDPRWALLVLGVQAEFTGASAWYSVPGRAVAQLIEIVNDVARKAQDSGVVVAYVQQQLARNASNIVARYLLRHEAEARPTCDVDPRVQRVSGYSFSTPLADAFSNPKLDVFLRNRGVNHIFLMGVDGVTSVARTAKSALERGYNVTFIGDGIVTAFETKWGRKLKAFAADDVFAITGEEFRDLLDAEASNGGHHAKAGNGATGPRRGRAVEAAMNAAGVAEEV
ncbi:MAG TPA: isochorismatase family protein [Xanthobacteraceae bacterium]|nr:isochorismatase family protein [Xanthobacteraceae bacterium]